MFACYFCQEKEREGYWSHYCSDCANLRRMLLIYSPEKCCSILKRTLTRDGNQIDFKISQEVKKIEANLNASDVLYNQTNNKVSRSFGLKKVTIKSPNEAP